MHLVAPQLSLGRRRSKTIQTRAHTEIGEPFHTMIFVWTLVVGGGRNWSCDTLFLKTKHNLCLNQISVNPKVYYSEPRIVKSGCSIHRHWQKTVILETCWPSQKVESSNRCDKDKLLRGGAAALLFFLTWHLPTIVLSSLFLEIIAWKWFPVKDVTKKIRRLCLLTFTTNDALSPPIVRPLFSEFYILPSYVRCLVLL